MAPIRKLPNPSPESAQEFLDMVAEEGLLEERTHPFYRDRKWRVINLSHSDIKSLPANLTLKIGEEMVGLELYDCPDLSSLPENLTALSVEVGKNDKITTYPKGLKAKAFYAEECTLSDFTSGIEVSEEFFLKNIRGSVSLPRKIDIGGTFRILDVSVEKYPELISASGIAMEETSSIETSPHRVFEEPIRLEYKKEFWARGGSYSFPSNVDVYIKGDLDAKYMTGLTFEGRVRVDGRIILPEEKIKDGGIPLDTIRKLQKTGKKGVFVRAESGEVRPYKKARSNGILKSCAVKSPKGDLHSPSLAKDMANNNNNQIHETNTYKGR